MEKIWELLRLCMNYLRENSKTWRDREEMRKKDMKQEEQKRGKKEQPGTRKATSSISCSRK